MIMYSQAKREGTIEVHHLMLMGVASVKVQKAATTKPREYDVTKTASFREAMEDVKHGRVYHAESVDDMFKQILG